MSGRPGTSQLHRISALRASSAIAAGTPRAKSPPPRFSAFHPAHVVASQSLEPCTKSYRAPAQAYISRSIVAQVAHIAHTSTRSRQPPTLHHTFVPTCRSDSRPSTPKLTRCGGSGAAGGPHRTSAAAPECVGWRPTPWRRASPDGPRAWPRGRDRAAFRPFDSLGQYQDSRQEAGSCSFEPSRWY